MAEREGFEPPELSFNGFQDRRHKPLGHLSSGKSIASLGGSGLGVGKEEIDRGRHKLRRDMKRVSALLHDP